VTSGHAETMMDAFSPSEHPVPRPGNRCQSSSVTKGHMGCSKRVYTSKQVQSTARDWLRLASASGVVSWLYTCQIHVHENFNNNSKKDTCMEKLREGPGKSKVGQKQD
jgi:hypothetical protein